jgi:hypothetical protein
MSSIYARPSKGALSKVTYDIVATTEIVASISSLSTTGNSAHH